ncbi:MAG: C40 family peptidase [Muribaculaceae bacterium]|nr:C40 family peptidase [Muribaculaceae bacterium]
MLINIRKYSRSSYLIIAFLFCVMMSSCHSHRKITATPGHPEVSHLHVGKPNKTQKKIIDEACEWIGTPYKYGGVSKGDGCDCSGMVMVIYESIKGVKIPRNSAKQSEFCQPINADEVEAGDLVFFATGKDPDRVSHVGLVIDNNSFIHASSSKGVVISQLTSPYYQRTFRMYGRVPD